MKARWIVAGVVVVGAATGLFVLMRPKEAPAQFRTAQVERGSIVATVSATGTVNPVTMVQVGSQVSGTIQSLFADFNSTVKRNQVVAQLDPSFMRSQLAQAEASLGRAEVNVADADRTYKRTQELQERNLVSQADVDAAQATLDRAKADVKQARATVDQARVNLEHTTITSPIDGVVVARNVDVGQTVAASLQAPVLFEIANDLTDMQVEASIDEADIGQVQVGQTAHFTVDAYPDTKFDGRVAQIRLQPITVQNVVTYTTVIAVRNPELKLRPGMTANVTVEVARREDVLKIPNGALTFKPPQKGKGGEGAAGGRRMRAGLAWIGPSEALAAEPPAGRGASFRGRVPGASTADDTLRGRIGRRGISGRGGPGRGTWGAAAGDSVSRRPAGEDTLPARGGPGGAVGSGRSPIGQGAAGGDSASNRGGAGPGAWSGAAGGGGGRFRGDTGGGPASNLQTVWVMKGAGGPEPVKIRTGITDGYFTEVVEGPLGEGDKVCTGMSGSGSSTNNQGANRPTGSPFGRGGFR